MMLDLILGGLPGAGYERLTTPHLRPSNIAFPKPPEPYSVGGGGSSSAFTYFISSGVVGEREGQRQHHHAREAEQHPGRPPAGCARRPR